MPKALIRHFDESCARVLCEAPASPALVIRMLVCPSASLLKTRSFYGVIACQSIFPSAKKRSVHLLRNPLRACPCRTLFLPSGRGARADRRRRHCSLKRSHLMSTYAASRFIGSNQILSALSFQFGLAARVTETVCHSPSGRIGSAAVFASVTSKALENSAVVSFRGHAEKRRHAHPHRGSLCRRILAPVRPENGLGIRFSTRTVNAERRNVLAESARSPFIPSRELTCIVLSGIQFLTRLWRELNADFIKPARCRRGIRETVSRPRDVAFQTLETGKQVGAPINGINAALNGVPMNGSALSAIHEKVALEIGCRIQRVGSR